MFESSLFASNAVRSRQRGWAALLSFAAQAVLLGIFVLVPLMFTDALPVRHYAELITVPESGPPPQPRAPKPPEGQNRPQPRPQNPLTLQAPSRIPTTITTVVDPPRDPVAADSGPTGPYIPGLPAGMGSGTGSGLMTHLLTSSGPVHSAPKPPSIPKPVQVSRGVAEGLLIHKVVPTYPHLAVVTRVQGEVVLQAVIGRDGTIQNLRVISGHPLLIQAAMDAVRQWRYRPYLLNNEPVDVDTQVNVHFSLGQNN